MPINDLRRTDLPDLDWSRSEEALATVYAYAVGHAKDAENWYTEKRRPKRVGGRVFRIAAILLLGIAAIMPVLSQIYADGGKPTIAPAWASVALVLAATLIALDRYFGFSTGWTRFMAADLEIGRLRRDFEFDWHRLEIAEADEIVVEQLQRAHRFVADVDRVVAQETNSWADEFRDALDNAASEIAQRRHSGT